jgi:hypothetical protein
LRYLLSRTRLLRPTRLAPARLSRASRIRSDHDTEEGAARAFDRAAINKAGRTALTNFDVSDYAEEVDELQRMALPDLVAALRSKARACVRIALRWV